MLKPRLIVALLVSVAAVAPAAAKPIEVSAAELIAHPAQFNGKRVSFVGYFDSDGHAWSLSASRTNLGIFADFRNTILPIKPIQRIRTGTFVRVVGTFRYRKITFRRGKNFNSITQGFGWMNDYDKEITDITEFTRVDDPRI
jgi:hypothetical protein